jgi:hypothetical protein
VENIILKRFRIQSFPTMVLLDPEGKVHSRVERADLEDVLEEVLSKQ